MPSKPLVLAVDDDMPVLRLLKLQLSTEGFSVVGAQTAEEALNIAEQQRPDIAVLDVMMGPTNGYDLMAELRERKNIPVIMLTGKEGEAEKIHGFEMGADDYLTKPFNVKELSARIRAVLRRSINHTPSVGNVVKVGDIEVDLGARSVRRNGDLVPLSRIEWLLLQNLAGQAGKLMSNAELLTNVWGPEFREHSQYLRVWVSRLRTKLERNPSEPKIIKTFPSMGYMFDVDQVAAAAT